MKPKRKLHCKENGMAIEKYTPLLAADVHYHCKCKGNFKINQLSDLKLSALQIIYVTLSGFNMQKPKVKLRRSTRGHENSAKKKTNVKNGLYNTRSECRLGRSSSCFGLLTPTPVQHPLVVLHCSSVVLRRNCLQELPERWDRTADDDFLTTNSFLIFCRNCRRRLSEWSTFRDTEQSSTHCSQLRSILPRPPKKEEKKKEFCKFLLKFSPRAVSGCIVEGSHFSIIPEERIVDVDSNIINNVSSSQHIDGGVKKPPPKRTFCPGYPEMLHPKNHLSWRSWAFFLMGITTTILLQQLPSSLLHAPSLSAGLINLAKAWFWTVQSIR